MEHILSTELREWRMDWIVTSSARCPHATWKLTLQPCNACSPNIRELWHKALKVHRSWILLFLNPGIDNSKTSSLQTPGDSEGRGRKIHYPLHGSVVTSWKSCINTLCVRVCMCVCVYMCVYMCVCVCSVPQLCPTLCNPMNNSLYQW